MDLLPIFESIYEYMVEKIGNKDAKKIHFCKKMELCKKSSIEDKLLIALEYLREYRTYFHLGRSYGVSESACYRACRWVEDK